MASEDGIPTGRATIAWLVVLLVVFLTALLMAAGAQPAAGYSNDTTVAEQNETSIEYVTLSGEGYIDEQFEIVKNHSGDPFVWHSENLTFAVDTHSASEQSRLELCGRVYDDENESIGTLTCKTFRHGAGYERTTFNVSSWPDDVTGEHTIEFELRDSSLGSDNRVLDTYQVDVVIIEKDGDYTGDGLKNEREVELGLDFTSPDTSGNGLTDWQEVEQYGTDPHATDTTGDGIDDATIVRLGLDPTEPYIVHMYAGGLLTFIVASIGLVLFLVSRFVDLPRPVIGDSPEPTTASETGASPQAGASPTSGENPNGPPEEQLLTNTEYVREILIGNGGRVKQQQIVEETDWSKAKVSRVLSELEEDGTIERVRIGRENIVDYVGTEEAIEDRIDPEQESTS